MNESKRTAFPLESLLRPLSEAENEEDKTSKDTTPGAASRQRRALLDFMSRMPDNSTEKTSSPIPEIETAEWLAERGWERMTLVMESDPLPGEEWREREILADPSGKLWILTSWHGKSGLTHRAERRQITREAACAHIARFMIPNAFWRDFRECQPAKLRLETAIQETMAFLLLMANTAGGQSYLNFTGDKGDAIQAGITSLSHRLGDELSSAFYAAEDAE